MARASRVIWHAPTPAEARNLDGWSRSEGATIDSLGRRLSSSFNVRLVAAIAECGKVTQVLIWAQIGEARGLRRRVQQGEGYDSEKLRIAGQ